MDLFASGLRSLSIEFVYMPGTLKGFVYTGLV